jgi:SAM-dependent methyltransferase
VLTKEHTTATGVTPEPIFAVATGFMASKHLGVAVDVGLFEQLAGGPRTLDELAAQTGIPRRTLRIVADAMVALGFVEKTDGRYRNGPVAATYLSGTGPAELRPTVRLLNRISYAGWMKLEEAVRSGGTQARFGHFSEEEQQIFSAGVEGFTTGPAQSLAATYDFGRHRRVLDLGGGTGSFLIPVLRRYGGLRATLFELPSVTPIARERLALDPATRGVDVVAGDMLSDPLPDGHDAVIVANVIHVFAPERNIALLRHIRAHVPAGARLLLIDLWTDPTHTHPVLAALMAGEFLVTAGEGDVYSEEEVREWLEQTGWRFVERTPLAGPNDLIVAEAKE